MPGRHVLYVSLGASVFEVNHLHNLFLMVRRESCVRSSLEERAFSGPLGLGQGRWEVPRTGHSQVVPWRRADLAPADRVGLIALLLL